MRLQGRITSWDDEKGFGFIVWHGDGSQAFVHIKAFARASRRPVLGDIVTYETAEGRNGKSSAANVRFTDRSRVKKQPAVLRKGGSFAVFLVTAYVCFLCVAAYTNRISWMLVVVYFVASLVTFVAYWGDKTQARNGRRRTRESNLHLMGALGGWPGALAAQRLFRHKSSKQEFLFAFWATVVVNVAAVVYLAWIGKTSVINQFLESIWRIGAY